jgi:hypothetical protein
MESPREHVTGDANAPAPPAQRPPLRRRVWRPWLWSRHVLFGLAVLALTLVAVRLVLPTVVRDYVNDTLDRSPDYDGRVGEVDLHLWRGAYTIHDLDIVKTNSLEGSRIPFFKARSVDLAIEWEALWNRRLVGRIVMDRPELNFVAADTEEDTQTGADQPWLDIIKDLFPFRINSAIVKEGTVRFIAVHTEPPVEVFMEHVNGSVENLTNIEGRRGQRVATVTATAVAMDTADFTLDAKLDPSTDEPNFEVVATLLGLDVTTLNDLTNAYGKFDFERGNFELVVEARAENGRIVGYAKPLFQDLRVISFADLKEDDALRAFWEAIVGTASEVLENREHDQFATRVPLEGDIESPDSDALEIIGAVLRNAFVRAFMPQPEGSVVPVDVEGRIVGGRRDRLRRDPGKDEPDGHPGVPGVYGTDGGGRPRSEP